MNNKNSNSSSNRKVVGKVDILFSLTQELPYQNFAFKQQVNKKRNGKGYAKMDSIFTNENSFENPLLFIDDVAN